MVIAALLTFSASAAAAQPLTPTGKVPEGFPPELTKFVAGTPEFQNGPWFQGACKGRGGDIGRYINDVMDHEARLLYWSTPPQARFSYWFTDPLNPPKNIDITKEPPSLPKLFPAAASDGDAYSVSSGSRFCVNDLKQFVNPANNAWGFTWAQAPDGDSVEKIRQQNGSIYKDDTLDEIQNPCAERNSPYCQKAFWLDCSRAAMNPDTKAVCLEWNFNIGQLFTGITNFIEANTTWLDRIGQFFGIIGDALWTAGVAIVDAFVGIVLFIAGIVMFVINPASAVDDLANAMHAGAVGFTTSVLQGLASVGHFDPGAPWFLKTYAASTGIGLVVMAFMAVLMIWRTGSGGGSREDLHESLFKQLPLGAFLAAFAPAIGAVLSELTRALTNGIAAWTADNLNAAIAKLALMGIITAHKIPGGAFIGIILFLLMIFGTLAVFVGMAIQSIALPIAGAVAGISWGMWVHPRWRRKALKVPFAYLGVLLSKPLLFLLLGIVFAIIDGNSSIPAMIGGGLPLLVQLVLAAVALMVAGLAPFSLLKHAPLLPTAADALDSQPGGGFGTAAVVGAGVSAAGDRGTSRGESGAQTAGSGGQHTIAQNYAQQQPQGSQTPQPRTASPAAGGNTSGGAGAGPGGAGQKAGQAAGGAGQRGGAGAAAGGAGGMVGAGGAAAVGAAASATRGAAAASSAATGAMPVTGARATPGGAAAGGQGAAAAQGTASGAARAGAASGAAASVAGVAAQVAVAGLNKARSAAHTRHAPEVDDDVVRGDD
ncbi:hypothetical protein [Alloactinosynnema sp. L-07]|uniref:hypothetical protein n=1 Tax=Alloactinosynnema sp. L-07 TaxID=1653480 RepID=UPI001E2C8F23|nr:hypothetical protein [Alloactinosynnema sp. L-07]